MESIPPVNVVEGKEQLPRRGRGRPKGVKNKIKPPAPFIDTSVERLVPPPSGEIRDFRHADPMTMLDRQFSIIDWVQQALRNEITRAQAAKGEYVLDIDVKKLLDLSNSLARSIEALKKYQDMTEELQKRMTAEQLLEAAIKKIEGQDLRTINYALKRLRAYREKMAPMQAVDYINSGMTGTAMDAIASLDDESK